MKKYFLSLVAIAAMLFATSCQESLVEPQVDGTTTFTVQVPGQMGTKATPYTGNVNKLYVQVYPEDLSGDNPIYQPEVVQLVDGFFTVSISLIQDQKYDIIFWAQNEKAQYNVADLRKVGMAIHHNSEEGAAFFAYLNDFVPTGTSQPVTLKRPFAQLNLGTTEASLKPNSGKVFLSKSKVKVSNVAKVFNTVTGMGEEPKVYETILLDVPQSTITVNNVPYQYISMDYLPIVGDDQALVTVAAEIELTNKQVISHEFTNVPVRENYRTNIVGNLISSTTDFEVEIDDRFEEDYSDNDDIISNDYLVVDNVGDAEDAFEDGETHVAINNIGNNQELELPGNDTELYLQLPDSDGQITIKRDAGNFNISVPDTNPSNTGLTIIIDASSSTVDFTGQANVIYSTTASNTLNLNGAEVGTIIVKKGNVVAENGTIVENLKNESTNNQSISVIVDENSVVNVGDDQNIVVLQGSPSSLEVATAQQLYEAISLIEDGGTISIKADIVGLETVVVIDKNLKILGNGKSISSSASRVIRITKKEVEVVINDLDIISTAERIGDNDIRGISIDSMPVEEVSLTLNNCSVDFEDDSASDYSYGVNFTGGTTNTLIINGGVYEGANAINLRGDEHEISIEEAKLTSIYSFNEMYFGQCIRLEGTGSVVNVKNTIFNGDHAVAIGGNPENEITVEGNTDNTKYLKVKAGDKSYYSLEEAIGSIESEGVIKLLFSFESDPVTIPNGKTITLNLNGKKITGVDKVPGNYSLIDNQGTLTINGPGKMTLSIAEGIEKASGTYSAVIANTPGCSLIISEDAEIKHSGYGEIENTYNVYEPKPVAKVGNTEYYSIDDAIAAWTNNTTLTLLADVTLSDVVKIKSTEHHILNLSTFTMTAADKKHAIEITCEGQKSETYALTINADATNPGGITATGKSCIYYKKSGTTQDRPIIRIYNGVFNGSYSINVYSSNRGTNCPTVWIYDGVFNCYMSIAHGKMLIYGGTFNASINCTGDSTAYRQISGGRFKSWQFMTADASNKFWVGTAKETYDVGVYVDKDGYLVVGGPVITEAPGINYEKKSYKDWNSFGYLKYSSAAEYGLYYEK